MWQRIRAEIQLEKEKDRLLGVEGRVQPCVLVQMLLGHPVLPHPMPRQNTQAR